MPAPQAKAWNLLNFVRERPALQQLSNRLPSKNSSLSDALDDGHYPRIKAYCDYECDDLKKLVATSNWEEIAKVINAIELGKPTAHPEFLGYLASAIHDRTPELPRLLHRTLADRGLTPSNLVTNYLVQSAAHHKDYDHMMQLLFEATVTDSHLDINTYLKMLSQIFFDYQLKFERKEFITYLYTLFANDHTVQDFKFGVDLLQQYIENNFQDFPNKATADSGKSEEGPMKKGRGGRKLQDLHPSEEERLDETGDDSD